MLAENHGTYSADTDTVGIEGGRVERGLASLWLVCRVCTRDWQFHPCTSM